MVWKRIGVFGATLALSSVLLLGGGAIAMAQPASVVPLTTMHIVVGGATKDSSSFDISWVEQSTNRYYLADRTNNAVDRFDAVGDTFTSLLGQGSFHSPSPCTGASDPFNCGGPNGVVTDSSNRVWASDGPVTPGTASSSIKVLDPSSGAVISSIATNGKYRSDELAYDPADQMVLLANPDFSDAFLTWLNVKTLAVAGTFHYNPTNTATWGGLEQPVYNPKSGLFYQAKPGVATNGTVTTPGEIDVFKPVPVNGTGQRVGTLATPNCQNGPTGLALTRNGDLVGACDNGGIVVNIQNGANHALIRNVGGADEIWSNLGDGNVYFAQLGPQQVAIANGQNDHFIGAQHTGAAAHSVAADANNNHIFVPIGGGGVLVFQSS